MRTFGMWALALAVSVLCAAPARPADEPQKNKGKTMIAEEEVVELLLLRQKAVQEDLKLSSSEADKIAEYTSKQHDEARKVLDLPEADRKAKFDRLAAQNEEFLTGHLTADQRKRLNQIAMHEAGLLWVTRSSVARELNLTDQQKQKARDYQKEARDKLLEVMSGATKESRREKLAALRKDNHDKLMSLLTDEQKAKWQKLAGEPLKGELRFEEPKK
jgi:Spy/CpxP family protein refolding chaperone